MEEKKEPDAGGLGVWRRLFYAIINSHLKGCGGASKSVHWKPIQRQYKDLTCLILTGK
jgi:hypothetical protein